MGEYGVRRKRPVFVPGVGVIPKTDIAVGVG